MNIHLAFTALLLTVFTLSVHSQDMSPNSMASLGEELFEKGDFMESANYYYKAWEQKIRKKEWLYRAGQAYSMVNDYENVRKVYSELKGEKKFPDAQLLYARSLKNLGNCSEATKEYLDYLYNYDDGDDKELISKRVQNEIKGCELSAALKQAGDKSGMTIKRLPNEVNTPSDEFNPITFDKDILYYASNYSGQSKFYRTQISHNGWEKGIDPPLFPVINGVNLGNGAFSPDFKRFYFNQCASGTALQSDILYNDACELFVIEKKDDKWLEPVKMKDYINTPGTTNIHPHVVQIDGKEVIYFSSDRDGGYGGLDLWYIVRDLSSGIQEYTYPTNLGKNINSEGDEISPYYAMLEGNLYYSSNGKVSVGGFDVFRSRGSEAFWEQAENAGFPYNSSADDFQIVWNSDGSMGYLVSNRSTTDKSLTTDYDLFAFETGVSNDVLTLKGTVFEDNSKRKIDVASVSLYKVMNDNKELISSANTNDGSFQFQLESSTSYLLETTKNGYLTMQSEFNTNNLSGAIEVEQNIFLVEGYVSDGTPPDVAKNTHATIVQNTDRSSVETAQESESQANRKEYAQAKSSQTANANDAPDHVHKSHARHHASNDHRSTPTSSTEIEPVDNKTVRITQPSGSQGNYTQSSYQNSSYTSGHSASKIEDARPINEKRVEIVTQGSADPVPYPSKLDGSTDPYRNQSMSARRADYYSGNDDLSGQSFKVQICSVSKFNSQNSSFSGVKTLGNLDTEYLSSRNLTRVLLGTFKSRFQAEEASRKAKAMGFPGAFVVEYFNGQRTN